MRNLFSYERVALLPAPTTWANRADQYVASGNGNTYNLYLDGGALPMTDRVRGAVEVIFDEIERARASYVG